MKKITIGQMAKLNNVSKQTLRLYDKLGILSPSEVSLENGYRYYSVKQCAQLDMIQYMKSLDMSLKDIKEIFESKEIDKIKNILIRKNSDIDKRIEYLKHQKIAIQKTLDSYDKYENSPKDGTIIVEYIKRRFIYCIDSKVNFYDYSIDMYEKILRELKEQLILDELPPIYFCNAGSILRYNKFIEKNFISTEIFVFLDKKNLKGLNDNNIFEVEPSMYLCIYCDNFDKEKDYALKLLEYANKNNYKISGDYICETLSELPIIRGDERGMFLKLQVPIKI